MVVADVVDALAGIAAGSVLDGLRRRKPVTRDNAQASYAALFEADDQSAMSAAERAAVAVFVAGLHADEAAMAFYRGLPGGADEALDGEIARAAASGPYGRFPAGPLSAEDVEGPVYAPAGGALGPRLVAALAHVHMLVFHPRDATAGHVRALEAAGWSADGIVVLSQLVSFLAFQLRAAAGLRALGESRG